MINFVKFYYFIRVRIGPWLMYNRNENETSDHVHRSPARPPFSHHKLFDASLGINYTYIKYNNYCFKKNICTRI